MVLNHQSQYWYNTPPSSPQSLSDFFWPYNHKNYNFLYCDWFKKLLLSTNSLAKLLSDILLLDDLLSDSSISQSHSKL